MTEIKEFRVGDRWITAPNKCGSRWLTEIADEWRPVCDTKTPLWWESIREGSYWIWREPMAAFISAVKTGAGDQPDAGVDWWISRNEHWEPRLYWTLWSEDIHIIPIHLSRLKPLCDSLNGKDNHFRKRGYDGKEEVIQKGVLWGKRIDVIEECRNSPLWEIWEEYVECEEYWLNKILEKYEGKI